MRRVPVGRGKQQFRLEWSQAKYCSDACVKAAQRRAAKRKKLLRVFGDE